jgi:hypothetical protein
VWRISRKGLVLAGREEDQQGKCGKDYQEVVMISSSGED